LGMPGSIARAEGPAAAAQAMQAHNSRSRTIERGRGLASMGTSITATAA
jgi:hypothetical protein